jgi:hypothetical protein
VVFPGAAGFAGGSVGDLLRHGGEHVRMGCGVQGISGLE